MTRTGAGVSYKPIGVSSSSSTTTLLRLVPYCRRYLIAAMLVAVPFVVLFCLFIPDVSTSTTEGLTQLQAAPSGDRDGTPAVKYDGGRNVDRMNSNPDDDEDVEEGIPVSTTETFTTPGGRKINAAREDRTRDGSSDAGDVNHDITSVDDVDRSNDTSTTTTTTATTSDTDGICQLSIGRWIQDSKISHTHVNFEWCSNMTSTCHLQHTNWQNLRWKPNEEGCELKDLEVTSFLRTMQNKSILFVGDDVASAMVETLLCVISQVEAPKVVYNNMAGNGSNMWRVEGWGITLTLVWSPYWVHETGSWGYRRLTMNKLDVKWAQMVPSTNIVVLGSGAWTHTFLNEPAAYVLHDRGLVVGCHGCEHIMAKDALIEVKPKSISHTHILNNKRTNESRPTKVKEMSPFTGFRSAIRSCILGIRSLPGYHGTTILLQPPPPTIYYNYNNFNTTSINNVKYTNAIYNAISLRMKSIQQEEINNARLRFAFTNNAPIGVIDTLLPEIQNSNDISCGNSHNNYAVIPSYSFTWNQFLYHTLGQLLSSSVNSNEN